jgi:acetylornithine deacetylase
MSSSRIVEILDRLVSFPTISRDTNLELIAYIQSLLLECGGAITLVPNEEGTKASLYATIGPARPGGVLLSGHTDVVPVEGQSWSSDPFRLVRRGERLYGRGTCDMKGFLACMLAAAETASTMQLARPLHLAFSYDEEIGCIGVRPLIEAMREFPILPGACIVGEPTMLDLVISHKGKVSGRIVCSGHECHSSLAPEGLNAIHLAAEMVRVLRDMQGNIMIREARDDGFAMPFTTIHVGMIRGGTALNIVPKECTLEFEIRNVPEDDVAALLQSLRDKAGDLTQRSRQRFAHAAVTVEILNSYPGMQTGLDTEVVALVKRLTGRNTTRKVDFGTEGGLFSGRLNLATVVCGPGDIRDAHKPDESISLDQLASSERMLHDLLEELAN